MLSLQSSARQGVLRPLRKIGLAAAARWPFPVKCRIHSGRAMFVDLRSAVSRGIFMRAEFDPAFFLPLKKILRPGDVFLDVGANVGYYSMLALDLVGSDGVVHAFEIDPRPLRCLRKSIATERIPNLRVHEVAVGNQIGRAKLVRESDCGNSHLTSGHSAVGMDVGMTTLDSWHAEQCKPRIRAIKLDIEGGELAALQGASQLLLDEAPAIVCEAWDNVEPAFSKAALFLRELGYTIEAIPDVHSPAFFGYSARASA